MGVYIQVNGELGDQVASTTGWGDFSTWLEGVPPERCESLRHLWAYGWTGRVREAGEELSSLLRSHPPAAPDVRETAENLLRLIPRTAEVVVITDGVGEDDGVEEE